MEVGIRFSSPLPENTDLERFNEMFSNDSPQVEEILKNAPYEISILACLIERIENKLQNL